MCIRDSNGTTNTVVKFTGATTGGNSSITDDGTTVTTTDRFDVTGGAGTVYDTASIEIRTNSTPRISFHRPGFVASQLGMETDGVIRTYNNPGTGYEQFAASNVYANGFASINSASDVGGNLRFTAANPYMVSSSYIIVPGGAYFNVGTVYFTAQAQFRGGISFCVDLDPRWVIKLVKSRQMDQVEAYKRHVIDQALTLLKAHDNIRCMFITPKLLEALAEKISLKKAGITGIFCGGTEMTPQFHRWVREEVLEGVFFAPTYGNTLMGLATHKPFDIKDNYAIIYYPPIPRAVLEVVDPEHPTKLVPYGHTGRVRLTTLTKECFIPRFLERDEAEREPPCDAYPWDGVRNVRPFSKLQTSVTEGVY